ncbi:MAG TPA: gamma-glutamyltransferase, partial [Pseudomonadales bacterium]|nr:gamma-glutamyltransferase [Pseudomonadales bacterium]
MARNVVATSQPLAAQAGLDALRRGGNAVDAALTAAITLTVVEPNNNGVGSDAFAIVGFADGTIHGLNASGRSPAGWTYERFARGRTGSLAMPLVGWDSVTVPGAVSAWVALSERFGKLPFERLFDAAIGYADDGFHVGPKTAFYWQLSAPRFREFPDFIEHFLPGGRAPRAGELFRRPDLARTLRAIADTRGEAFYRGELAQRIADTSRRAGGAMTAADLDAHRPSWVTPTRQAYRGIELLEIPPNGQGLAAQLALAILAHFDLAAWPVDDARSVHLQIEAMKIAIRAAFDHFADPAAMRVTPEQLLGAARLKRLADG